MVFKNLNYPPFKGETHFIMCPKKFCFYCRSDLLQSDNADNITKLHVPEKMINLEVWVPVDVQFQVDHKIRSIDLGGISVNSAGLLGPMGR